MGLRRLHSDVGQHRTVLRLHGRKQNKTKEFLMADRNMGVLPVSLSMLATSMSAITVLGTPAKYMSSALSIVWCGSATSS